MKRRVRVGIIVWKQMEGGVAVLNGNVLAHA